MEFTATFMGRGARGHFYLEDVQAANGMKRSHVWINQSYCGFPALPCPCKILMNGTYRRYREGPDGWTLNQIFSVEIVPADSNPVPGHYTGRGQGIGVAYEELRKEYEAAGL